MRARNGLKAAGLVVASALLIVVLTAAGLLSFIFYNISAGRDWTVPSEQVSVALIWSGNGYTFTVWSISARSTSNSSSRSPTCPSL